MAISKTVVTMGTDPVTNLTIKRRFLTFEANLELEYIRVYYEEFLVTPNGKEIEHNRKSYLVKDYVTNKVTNTTLNDGTVQTTVTAEPHNNFTQWFAGLGSQYIIPSIDATLLEIPLNAINDHLY